MTKKQEVMKALEDAFKLANREGIMVVVASDEEGNRYNEVNAGYMEYDGTKEDVIALAVMRDIPEEEIFVPEK